MIQLGLIALYPLLVHLAIVLQTPMIQALAVVALTAGLFYRHLARKTPSAWLLFITAISITLGIAYYDATLYILYVPPIVLPLMLFAVFGHSLLPGNTPLVTDIGEKSRGPLSPEMVHYTRRVTQMWSLVFLLMASWSALLPFTGNDQLWSLFTNVINYVLSLVLFVGEFWFRKFKFPDHNHPSFFEYLQIVASSQIRRH